ncbi:hypothetical protein [Nonomuraea lactucae]|uniref:hypothetical protein n=1 Tax=Nonomuraea lactucae TaxID=2249762 RepID=UPI000DE2DE08|nr:hypothetical protein [Nonomuraea lactucae]
MILHEFLPRGQKVLINLTRNAMVAHAMELVPLEDLPAEYMPLLNEAKQAYQNGQDIVFNALVMAILFQLGMDVEAGD